MGERERLAIMNSLVSHLQGARVLDMFAGSGSLGIEALSRGASHATFVDNNRKAVSTIKSNLKLLDARDYDFAASGKYNIIFADPPYEAELAALPLADLPGLLTLSGILVLSTDKNTQVSPALFDEELIQVSDKTYARARITMWSRP